MAVAGINTILFVFNFFYSYNWGWVFAIIAYIAFIAVVFLALKENNIVNSIWFIPSITLLISFILVLVFRYLVSMGIFSPFALFFAGLWLKENLPDTIQKPKNHSTQSIQINAVGGADRIKMYKELLDSGAITQEEFDAKKKEILG